MPAIHDKLEDNRRYLATFLANHHEALLCRVANLGEIKDCTPDNTCPEHLIWMCREINAHVGEWSSTRLHRWLGFVQFGMLHYGLQTPDQLREIVREAKKTFAEDHNER